jgi:hypothetical protein
MRSWCHWPFVTASDGAEETRHFVAFWEKRAYPIELIPLTESGQAFVQASQL